MDHKEYNTLFEEEFADPLKALGFARVRKTRSLRYQNGTRDLWIRRVSGKWPHPGVAKTAICFRHSFLRPVTCDDPDSDDLYMLDFPRALRFEDFEGWLKPSPSYRPDITRREPSEFRYGDKGPDAVRKHLRRMRRLVEKRILPWANGLTEEGELAQIIAFGQQLWCEKRWMEDYRHHLTEARE